MKQENHLQRWQFWIDRGGTFTDIVGLSPDDEVVTHKLLSDNPRHYSDAAIQGIRDLLDLGGEDALPAEKIDSVKMGTTVATNALLEQRGEPTLLVITRGFHDALRIGYQNRPKLFALDIELPHMLYADVVEADERLMADGTVLVELEEERLRTALQHAWEQGLRSVAIVFMHGYRYPDHEQRAARTGARHRLHPGFHQPRDHRADEVGQPWRHHRGGRLPVAGVATLRGPGAR
jgi:5-oxoprolinase (ATP-hydrolysing)